MFMIAPDKKIKIKVGKEKAENVNPWHNVPYAQRTYTNTSDEIGGHYVMVKAAHYTNTALKLILAKAGKKADTDRPDDYSWENAGNVEGEKIRRILYGIDAADKEDCISEAALALLESLETGDVTHMHYRAIANNRRNAYKAVNNYIYRQRRDARNTDSVDAMTDDIVLDIIDTRATIDAHTGDTSRLFAIIESYCSKFESFVLCGISDGLSYDEIAVAGREKGYDIKAAHARKAKSRACQRPEFTAALHGYMRDIHII